MRPRVVHAAQQYGLIQTDRIRPGNAQPQTPRAIADAAGLGHSGLRAARRQTPRIAQGRTIPSAGSSSWWRSARPVVVVAGVVVVVVDDWRGRRRGGRRRATTPESWSSSTQGSWRSSGVGAVDVVVVAATEVDVGRSSPASSSRAGRQQAAVVQLASRSAAAPRRPAAATAAGVPFAPSAGSASSCLQRRPGASRRAACGRLRRERHHDLVGDRGRDAGRAVHVQRAGGVDRRDRLALADDSTTWNDTATVVQPCSSRARRRCWCSVTGAPSLTVTSE